MSVTIKFYSINLWWYKIYVFVIILMLRISRKNYTRKCSNEYLLFCNLLWKKERGNGQKWNYVSFTSNPLLVKQARTQLYVYIRYISSKYVRWLGRILDICCLYIFIQTCIICIVFALFMMIFDIHVLLLFMWTCIICIMITFCYSPCMKFAQIHIAFYTPVWKTDVLCRGNVRPSVCPSVRPSVRPSGFSGFSGLFFNMLWDINLKLGIYNQ